MPGDGGPRPGGGGQRYCDGSGRRGADDDPELLTWAHVAAVHCFLTGYHHLFSTPLTAAGCDRYYAASARVAELLGATGIPRSRAEAAACPARVRPGSGPSRRSRLPWRCCGCCAVSAAAAMGVLPSGC
ncbi:oxygenase MpaB family protein [Kitasatospora sp. NPDC002040]|uniref:oxygenase MpaB family protein n=1 Tax=Kitasatospora sp. NPDC002040 TaxID=3154661 RepID=UPI00332A70C4